MKATALIERLGLHPLAGEGGYYRETYRSPEQIPLSALPDRYDAEKSVSTAIYYLLTPDTCSLLHRLPSDEIYHFYLGDPVTMVQLLPAGAHRALTLGSSLLEGHHVQCVVPKLVWQGSFLVEGGSFALMGTTMAPAFDFSDFELGDRARLLAAYPLCRDFIMRLTRA